MEHLHVQGISIPRLGLGTNRMRGDACRAAVESALALGYRHIDTAEMYDNEEPIGEALAASGVARNELHVTTKVSPDNLSADAMRRACDASLRKLKLDYVDLYMIHWPTRDMDFPAVFAALTELKSQRRTRAIGVCNFTVPLLRIVVDELGVPIACNQVEYHAQLDQSVVHSYLRSKSIALTAFCPLGQGMLSDNPAMVAVARKHGVNVEQIVLKWLIDQDGVIAIPKALRPEHQRANLEALNLRLDDDDRRVIAQLPKSERIVDPSFAPEWDKVA
jgi:2,5-diketo-D-gluconate reductase B